MALPPDTKLISRYTIRHTLHDPEALSTTYLAYDEREEREVVVTEYFPAHIAERSSDGSVAPSAGQAEAFRQGLKYFRKEAEALREIDHSNLTEEIEDFEARGTAYRVSEHRAGASMATALEKNDGSVSERAAMTVMKPVLGALHALHRKGLLHGGLSPDAIYLTKGRKVLVRGFRGAQLQLARKTGVLEKAVVPGISPAEQYDPEGRQGPWTDVYAAAATFYRAVTGRTLPEAREPLTEDTIAEHLDRSEELSKGVRAVLKRALAPRPRARMQSAQAFLEVLGDPSKVLEEEEGEQPAAQQVVPAASEPEAPAGGEADMGAAMWGPASMAAAAAEAVKKDKEESRARRKADEEAAARREDRSARPAAAEEDEEGRGGQLLSGRLAMGGGAILLVVLLGGAVLFFTGVLGSGESNAESSTKASYVSLVTEGDSLFELADYEAAAARYEKARELDPQNASEDEHITERLLMIDRLHDAVERENYRRAMSRGDSLRARAQRVAPEGQLNAQAQLLYEQANEAYVTALDSRENDSLAMARVQEVRGVLEGSEEAVEETSLEEERERLFTRYRDQGEEALEEEDYVRARRKFTEALDYQPDNTYVRQRLEELRSRISEAERERQYERYVRQADSLFAAGQLEAARREYQLALDVKPGDASAASRVRTIDERLAKQEENQQQYQYHRGRGDVLFSEGDLEQAVESYQQALQYRPEDDYVRGRIEEAQQQIAAAKEAQEEKSRLAANRDENGIYTVVDEQPIIAGGRSALYDKISYPSRARSNGIEGRVYVRATVAADGTVQAAEVLRGIGYGADEEARQAVLDTKFEPATLDGKPVPAYRTLFVDFRLEK